MDYTATPRTSRRESEPPLDTLRCQLQEKLTQVDECINQDLTSIPEDPEFLSKFGQFVKSVSKEYLLISNRLSSRLLGAGCIEETQNLRKSRHQTIKDLNEILESVNQLSSNDNFSLLETSSIRSGLSLTSQMSEYNSTIKPGANAFNPMKYTPITISSTVAPPSLPINSNIHSTFLSVDNNPKLFSNAPQNPTHNDNVNLTKITTPQVPSAPVDELPTSRCPFDLVNHLAKCKPFPPQSETDSSQAKVGFPQYLLNKSLMDNLHEETNKYPTVDRNALKPKPVPVHQPFIPKIVYPGKEVNSGPSNNKYPNYMPWSVPQIQSSSYTNPNIVSSNPLPPPTASATDVAAASLEVMSKHLLHQDLIKNSIKKFDGDPLEFFPWASKIESYLSTISVTPLQAIQFWESHCSGPPQEMITGNLSTIIHATWQDAKDTWSDLLETYGSSQAQMRALKNKIKHFPVIKDKKQGELIQKLFRLTKNILHYMPLCPELQILNLDAGLLPLRAKLPERLQIEWRHIGQKFERNNDGHHPPFTMFVEFLKDQSKLQMNNHYEIITSDQIPSTKSINILQTNVNEEKASLTNPQGGDSHCLYHNSSGHELKDCKAFRKLDHRDRKSFVFNNYLCFRCLLGHRAADCQENVSCEVCGARHVTAMHYVSSPSDQQKNIQPKTQNDENKSQESPRDSQNLVLCTEVCQDRIPKSCSKTVLVEITMSDVPDKKLLAYCIIDEQASTTLIDEKVVSFFGKDFPSRDFTTHFASQDLTMKYTGHVVSGLKVKGILESKPISVETALSFPNIADTRNQVATPAIVRAHKHIAHLAKHFPEFNHEAEVLMLIGYDCTEAMAGQNISAVPPYVHKTPIGYSLVGKVCLGSDHLGEPLVLHTSVHPYEKVNITFNITQKPPAFDIFETRTDDELQGLSVDDHDFISMMGREVGVTDCGSIQLPLPLKTLDLPDNSAAVYMRTRNTLNKMTTQHSKLEAALQSIQNNLDKGFIEQVPSAEVEAPANKSWYLPIFTVEHHKKRKIRLVYDAAAKYHGISLNDALMQGPDFNNQLRSVLLRFRECPIAFCADIESMFNNFVVPPTQRDYLRFYWFKDNQPGGQIVPFRSKCHIFGCTSSPAVATMGLKFCASTICDPNLVGSRSYIENSFYVDDGLQSAATPEEAATILSGAIACLSTYNIRLHKIASNSDYVLNSFPISERASNPGQLPTGESLQHALGVAWDTKEDTLVMNVDIPNKEFTKRGIVSTVNSLYDPIGLVSPVILSGRLFQREVLPQKGKASIKEILTLGWDDPLPQYLQQKWESWRSSLNDLNGFHIPRSFYPLHFSPVKQEIHLFCDASDSAIGHVAYMRSFNVNGDIYVSFICSSSKVAPRSASTIPRLELCAALEASRRMSILKSELSRKPDNIYLYSDSMIVLGYINNNLRRFSKYVDRRITDILVHTKPENWNYIETYNNPADIASRPHNPSELFSSMWFNGPEFLKESSNLQRPSGHENIPPLPEEKLEINILTTEVKQPTPLSTLTSRKNNLMQLVGTVQKLMGVLVLVDKARQRLGINLAPRSPTVTFENALVVLIADAQQHAFSSEIKALYKNGHVPISSNISKLSPFIDHRQKIIRVGGRLKNVDIVFSVKHPILIPKESPLAEAIIQHYHDRTHHQGTHITHGKIIEAGFHIENGRQLIRQHLNRCVSCRKLRGTPSEQLMSDLPVDRLEETAPFTNVGIDVFGPFYIHDGINTRRTSATKKIWAIIFVCLPSRAIHLEPLSAMDTASFRNALTRFISVRGTCRIIRSDQGTNFTCARKQLQSVDISKLSSDLQQQHIRWIMNPPHASHHGGSWERKIGSVRRVMEASILRASNRKMSRDEFHTLLCEASSIVNNTPLWAVSSDPNDPSPLTPAMILTLKEAGQTVPPGEYNEQDLLRYGQLRYRRVQFLAQEFWKRWRQEYIQELTRRHKWKTRRACISVGDLVLIKDKNVPRNSWPVGRVSEVKQSLDGLVRSVWIKLPPLSFKSNQRSVYRSIADLVLLIPASSHKCS